LHLKRATTEQETGSRAIGARCRNIMALVSAFMIDRGAWVRE